MRARTLLLTLLAVLLVAAPAVGKASHKGWPKIDGELWINKDDVQSVHHGTALNDELLSGHSSDSVYGEGGRNVIWGDYKAQGNNTWQHDVLFGGPKRDKISNCERITFRHGENA